MNQLRPFLIIFFFLSSLFITVEACRSGNQDASEELAFLNLNDSVTYVGPAKCISCHANVHATFRHTGMGRSFGLASKNRSDAQFGPDALVYDTTGNFYYHPFWQHDTLKVVEFRISPSGDTIHKRMEAVDYIIGSGQHTNSHLRENNQYLFQVPLTYYTQKKIWDMAPGFQGTKTRFSRAIGMECMTCHNALPGHVEGSINKYTKIPLGIDCERCHGPGSLHVARKSSGEIIDTARMADLSIVNPSRLSIDRQMDLCQRCHLQGVAVLNEGVDWDDFRPGMRLADFAQVFLPRFEGSEDPFLMASQAERLRSSPCFQSGKLSCLNCHNPHVPVSQTKANHFVKACLSCHGPLGKDDCSLELKTREIKNGNNCITCHMPKSGSADIPHVAITDHKIAIPTADHKIKKGTLRFLRLENLSSAKSTPLQMALGFLRLYEGFSKKAVYLDSVAFYLGQSDEKAAPRYFQAKVHWYYLLNDYSGLIRYVENSGKRFVSDGYTAFRISEAYESLNEPDKAISYAEVAVKTGPLLPEFRNRYGSLLLKVGRIKEAEKQFRFILSEQEDYVPALANLGTIFINTGRREEGENLLLKAIRMNPDYDLAYQNLILFYKETGRPDQAKKTAWRWQENQAGNKEIKKWIEEEGIKL